MPIPVGPMNQQVMAVGDPCAAAQTNDLLALEPARVREVDGFKRGGIPQLGGPQPPRQLPLLAGGPLGVDEDAKPVLEAEGHGLVGAERLLHRLGHRAEFHGGEFFQGLFDQHGSSLDGV